MFITDKHSCINFTGDLLKPDGMTLISCLLAPPHTYSPLLIFPLFSIIEAITSHLFILSQASSSNSLSFALCFSLSLYFSAVSFSSTTPLNCQKPPFFSINMKSISLKADRAVLMVIWKRVIVNNGVWSSHPHWTTL